MEETLGPEVPRPSGPFSHSDRSEMICARDSDPIAQALLTSRCANKTIDDAGAIVDELLSTHPDVAIRGFPAHHGKPDSANAADADVVTEERVGGVRDIVGAGHMRAFSKSWTGDRRAFGSIESPPWGWA